MSQYVKVLIVVTLAVLSSGLFPAEPCGSMGAGTGTGGHDHGRSVPRRIGAKSERAIRDLFADPQGRALLQKRILADEPFLRELLAELVRLPETREVVIGSLDERQPSSEAEPTTSIAPSADAAGRVDHRVYRCPMHAEVTSKAPGACPKCGMALQPVTNLQSPGAR